MVNINWRGELLDKTFRIFVCLLVSAGFVLSTMPAAADTLPSGLMEAAKGYFHYQQSLELDIRNSTSDNQRGIQPVSTFDRATHRCHEGAGQAYRIYGEPTLFSKEPDGTYLFRAGYSLYYRKANRAIDLFTEPWKQGSGGGLEVRFKLIVGTWSAVGKSELLTAEDAAPRENEQK